MYSDLIFNLYTYLLEQEENQNDQNDNQNQTQQQVSTFAENPLVKLLTDPKFKIYITAINRFSKNSLFKLIYNIRKSAKSLKSKIGISVLSVAFAAAIAMKKLFESLSKLKIEIEKTNQTGEDNVNQEYYNLALEAVDVVTLQEITLNPIKLISKVRKIIRLNKRLQGFGDFLAKKAPTAPVLTTVALLSLMLINFIFMKIAFLILPDEFSADLKKLREVRYLLSFKKVSRVIWEVIKKIPQSILKSLKFNFNRFKTFVRTKLSSIANMFKSNDNQNVKTESVEILNEAFNFLKGFLKKLVITSGVGLVLFFGLKLLLDYLYKKDMNIFNEFPFLKWLKRNLDQLYTTVKSRLKILFGDESSNQNNAATNSDNQNNQNT